MKHFRRLMMIILALVILIGGTGISAQPAQAGACTYYHTVRPGESLYWIGRYYGVSWVHLAEINNVAPPKYIIYPGQVLCISYDGQVTPPAPTAAWSYSIVKVDKDTSVRIRTSNFPSNVLFEVSIGMLSGNVYQWIKVADLDSDRGGTFTKTFNDYWCRKFTISHSGHSTEKDFLCGPMVQQHHNRVWWRYPPSGYVVPTIWIVSVVRNSTHWQFKPIISRLELN